MKTRAYFAPILFVLISSFCLSAYAQESAPNLIRRTAYQTKTFKAGPKHTVAVVGSPKGSISVEGWNRNEIEISAEIEMLAASDDDLDQVAAVSGFMTEQGLTKLAVISVGPYDKKYVKKVNKKFPKRLRSTPTRVDYTIKVPYFTDLVIDGGIGDLEIKGLEGAIMANYLESNARFSLRGGTVQATIGKGSVDMEVTAVSWRGRFADVQLADGNLNLQLPRSLNANLNARVLREGRIENNYGTLKPVRMTDFSDKEMNAIAGSGGATLNFTVGSGTLSINGQGPLERAAN